MEFGLLALALILGIVTGVIAQSRGRDVFMYSLIGTFLPIIGLLLVLGLPSDAATLEQRALAAGARKKCRYCAELIRFEARVCRYCGRDFASVEGGEPGAQIVLQRSTRLRVDPVRGADSVANVARGTTVTVIRTEQGWAWVQTANGDQGWFEL
jgi:hypothetical protein